MEETPERLDAVWTKLEPSARNRGRRDAMDDMLEEPARATRVESLRDHPVVQRFRTEVTNELILADTVGQSLGLIQAALVAAP